MDFFSTRTVQIAAVCHYGPTDRPSLGTEPGNRASLPGDVAEAEFADVCPEVQGSTLPKIVWPVSYVLSFVSGASFLGEMWLGRRFPC